MVDEPSITDDGKVSLTTAELDMLESLLAAHDRGGFYMAYNAMTDSAEAALQSRIATFSGTVGGAALAANRLAQEANNSNYPGIYHMSQRVAESALQAIKDSNDTAAGLINDQVFFDSAEAAWETAGIVDQFPGNLLTGTLEAPATIATALVNAFLVRWGAFDETQANAENFLLSLNQAAEEIALLFTAGAWNSFMATLVADNFGKQASDMT